jgi:DNA-binding transcriptional regulator YiaG
MPNQFTGPAPVEQRFWSKVDRSGGPGACWSWTAGRFDSGYGVFRWQNKNHRAHKLAWVFTNGTVPEGLCVLHDCPDGDNPACCNPSHLWLGTNAQNSRDMVEKGRSAHGDHVPFAHRARGERHSQSKLTAEDVREIRRRYEAGGISQTALAREYDVNQTIVSDLIRRETWRHVT